MDMGIGGFFYLLKRAAIEWIDDDAPRLSAALAYYATFSMAPLLVICIALAGFFFGEQAARGQIVEGISDLAGREAGESIQAFILDVWQEDHGGWATVVSVGLLLFGATTVFAELKAALNTIWGVVVKPGQPVVTLLRDRFLSFSMVLVIGFLLVTSLIVSTVLAAITKYFGRWVPIHPDLLTWYDVGISMVVISILFALMFKLLPNIKVRWREVWLGATVTAGLFTIGKLAIGFYLGTSSVASTFGAAGSVAIFLLWVYYSACILFFGAEFTKCYAKRYGSGVRPNRRAMLISDSIMQEMNRQKKKEQSRAREKAAKAKAEADAAVEAEESDEAVFPPNNG